MSSFTRTVCLLKAQPASKKHTSKTRIFHLRPDRIALVGSLFFGVLMSRDGNGTYNRAVSPYQAGTVISATTVNTEMNDVASALTQSLSKDGQTTPTADLPMGGQKHTNVSNATARNNYAAAGQV
ncbi:MAG: hypothetical protein MUF29_10165, partial [Chitinophagaceae bacterium]|nr:hypothetical protein [Chitinophagaceae bacterium]